MGFEVLLLMGILAVLFGAVYLIGKQRGERKK